MKHNAWFLSTAFLLIILLAVKYIFVYFTPFFIGITIATLIHPVIDRFEQLGVSRSLSSLIFVILAFGSLLLLIGLAITGLWNEMEQLLAIVRHLPESFLEMLPTFNQNFGEVIVGLLTEVMDIIRRVPNAIIIYLLAAVTTFLVSRDKNLIVNFLVEFLPTSWQNKIFGFKREVVHGLFNYFKAQLKLMSITSCLSTGGFLFFGQPYAWILGSIAGVFDLIPMIGPSAVYVPVIIYYLLYGQFKTAISIGILWLTVMFIHQLSEPRIVGNQLDLHPLSTLIGMYLGVKVLGLIGFVFGPLIMICTKAFFIVVKD